MKYNPVKFKIKWNVEGSMQTSSNPSPLSLFVGNMLIGDVGFDMTDDIWEVMHQVFRILIGGLNEL